MKLFYFNVKGRPEPAKLCMKLAGKEFEDVQFDGASWMSKYKALSPTGQAPWLELDDGRILTQGLAINLYCAQLTGHLPSDPMLVARTVELDSCIGDFMAALGPSLAISDEQERLAARKSLTAPDGALTKKALVIENALAASKTPFYCGQEPTVADFRLYLWLSLVRSGRWDGIGGEFVDSFPCIAATRSKIAALPKVQEMYGSESGYEP